MGPRGISMGCFLIWGWEGCRSLRKGKETGFLETEIPFSSLSHLLYSSTLLVPPALEGVPSLSLSFRASAVLCPHILMSTWAWLHHSPGPVGGLWNAPPNSLRTYLGHSEVPEVRIPKRELLTCVWRVLDGTWGLLSQQGRDRSVESRSWSLTGAG